MDFRATGNDDGSSIANAFPTWALAKASAAAGDTIYIAPGTYRETVTLTADGSAGSTIKWIGDVNCEVYTSYSPGIVRTTKADPEEVLSTDASGAVLNMNGIDYNEFYNLTFDGTSYCTTNTNGDGCAVYYSTATAAYFRNCHFQGGYACVYRPKDGTFVDCLFTHAHIGIYGYSGNNTPNCIGCVAVNGSTGFFFATCYNTLSIGGKRGYHTCQTINCAAAGGEYGFYGTSTMATENCISWANYFAFAGSTDTKMNIKGSAAVGSGYRQFIKTSGSGYYAAEGNHVIEHNVHSSFTSFPLQTIIMDYTKLMSLRDIFIPSVGKGLIVSGSSPLATTPDSSTISRTTADGADLNANKITSMVHPYAPFGNYDYRGSVRVYGTDGYPSPPGIHSTVPIAIEIDTTSSAAITGTVSQSAPAIVFRGRGENIFEVPIPSGSYFTASVNVKHTGSTSAGYAQMVVSSSRINQSSGSIFDMFATESQQSTNDYTFGSLEIRVDPVAYDQTYVLKLQAPSTSSYATASFSDLTIN